MATEKRPLLDFEFLAPERNYIRINGEPYYLNRLEDVPLADRAKFAKFQSVWYNYATAAESGRAANTKTVNEMKATLRALVPLVVRDMPGEVLTQIPDGAQLDIVQAFLIAAGLMPDPQALMDLASRTITGRLSHDFNDSTDQPIPEVG